MLFFVVTYLKYTLERNHTEAQTRMWTSYSSKQDFLCIETNQNKNLKTSHCVETELQPTLHTRGCGQYPEE